MELFLSISKNPSTVWGIVLPRRASLFPAHKPSTIPNPGKLVSLLLLLLMVPGCAVNLAALPDSSFNAEPDNSARHAAYRSPAVVPVSASQSQSLTESTNDLLDIHGYSEDSRDPLTTRSVIVGKSRSKGVANASSVSMAERSDFYTIEAVDAPVQALLFSLASDAGVKLAINGELSALVTINSIDQTLQDTLTSLADQAGFAWKQHGNTLTVWGGQAFSYSYRINYLNIHRRTQSSVGLATQVGTINATDTGGGSIANSSQTRVENISEHHFWDSLAADIKSLLAQHTPGDVNTDSVFSINREAGLLTVYAIPDVHQGLQRYLKLLHGNTQRQVLIEATVVEVALSDSFDAGVDWQVLANGINGVNAAQVLAGAPLVAADTVNRITAPAGFVSLVQQGSNRDVQATLSLLEQFGDVRILSRPRIIALNNQSSVLKVVDNRVYFTVNVQRRQTEEKDEIVTETEIHTVPVGLVMNVTPQISEYGQVMLNVRPTLSRILGFVDDPNPELALANVRNGVPEIQVREMESMLQVRSGNVAIIGGLMQETQSDTDTRLPGLGRLPVIGHLFAKQNRERRQTELLIVLRPTVLDTSDSHAYPGS